jgi:acetyl-CoA C-acetyltransferase
MAQPVILSAARTPIGSFGGALAPVPAVELGAIAIRAAIERAGISPERVDETVMGMVLQGGAGQAPARQAALRAGVPESKSAWTVNKVCSSGLKAVMEAAGSIAIEENTVMVAGGMENMSAAPYFLAQARSGYRYGHGQLTDMLIHDGLWDPYSDQHMGSCAEVCAAENDISRAQQDAYAIESYRRANAAIAAGSFAPEIVPVVVAGRAGEARVDTDEEPGRARPEKIPALRPAFRPDGTVTAANASSVNDGAAALVVAGIAGWATHSQAPVYFTTAPAGAVRKLLANLDWSIQEVDLFEINEAFAVVSIYNNRELGLDPERVNVRGGAVALGHPIGASGARLLVTLLHIMQQQGRRRGIASLCNGGGEATALAVELIG